MTAPGPIRGVGSFLCKYKIDSMNRHFEKIHSDIVRGLFPNSQKISKEFGT